MIGGMSGYYEPEWDEETVYEALDESLRWSDRPASMTDAEWSAALRIVGLTPASHAKLMEDFEREMKRSASGEDQPQVTNPKSAAS